MASAHVPISEATAARLLAAHIRAVSAVPHLARRRTRAAALSVALSLAFLALAVFFGAGR